MDREQIAVWHARMRTIFERAFPDEDIQNSRLLINKFVLKLSDSDIRQWTHRANPDTYKAAMTDASNEAAVKYILAQEAGASGKNNVAINPFGGRGGSCFGCGSYDHQIATCPLTRPDQHRDNNKPGGREIEKKSATERKQCKWLLQKKSSRCGHRGLQSRYLGPNHTQVVRDCPRVKRHRYRPPT
jgi:hypothetical protein